MSLSHVWRATVARTQFAGESCPCGLYFAQVETLAAVARWADMNITELERARLERCALESERMAALSAFQVDRARFAAIAAEYRARAAALPG